jgi:hypothetical protein
VELLSLRQTTGSVGGRPANGVQRRDPGNAVDLHPKRCPISRFEPHQSSRQRPLDWRTADRLCTGRMSRAQPLGGLTSSPDDPRKDCSHYRDWIGAAARG